MPPPDALLDMPTYALSLLGRRAREEMAATLPDGLRLGHLAVLGAVADGPPRAQRDIAEQLRIHPSDMVALVDDLAAKRLVRRSADPSDRRRRLVAPTAAGRRLTARATAESTKLSAEILRSLSAAERATVERLLRKALSA